DAVVPRRRRRRPALAQRTRRHDPAGAPRGQRLAGDRNPDGVDSSRARVPPAPGGGRDGRSPRDVVVASRPPSLPASWKSVGRGSWEARRPCGLEAMTKVLIVEDQPAVANALRVLFDLNDIEAEATANPDAALKAVARGDVDLVLQDMNFSPGAISGEEGIALFRRFRAADPELPVLLLTAWTSLETAVQLVKEGASDYLAKPWDDAKLIATVRNLLQLRALKVENGKLRAERTRTRAALAREHDLRGVVYESASDRARRVASTCAFSARRTSICATRSRAASSAKISFSD